MGKQKSHGAKSETSTTAQQRSSTTSSSTLTGAAQDPWPQEPASCLKVSVPDTLMEPPQTDAAPVPDVQPESTLMNANFASRRLMSDGTRCVRIATGKLTELQSSPI